MHGTHLTFKCHSFQIHTFQPIFWCFAFRFRVRLKQISNRVCARKNVRRSNKPGNWCRKLCIMIVWSSSLSFFGGIMRGEAAQDVHCVIADFRVIFYTHKDVNLTHRMGKSIGTQGNTQNLCVRSKHMVQGEHISTSPLRQYSDLCKSMRNKLLNCFTCSQLRFQLRTRFLLQSLVIELINVR